MKKVYELSTGRIKHYVAAEDEKDAYNQGTDPEQFPDINYLPFEINEVVVPGHTISVTADGDDQPKGRSRRKAD